MLAVSVAAAAACGGSSAGPYGGDGPNGDGDPVATTSVSVRDDFFEPMEITASAGATVTWTWEGNDQHNVTWVSANLPNSQTQSSGSHQVTLPSDGGQLDYYCTIHGTPTSGMRGSVSVE